VDTLTEGEQYLFRAAANSWAPAIEADRSGDGATLGVALVEADGDVNVAFTFDPRTGAFLGDPPATAYTETFEHFVASGLVADPPDSPLALVIALNAEADAPYGEWPRMGPLGDAFQTFAEDDSLQGISPTPAPPAWSDIPALCRDLADAPKEVLAGLSQGQVVIDVPNDWLQLADEAGICLTNSLGTTGCTLLTASGTGRLVLSDVYTVGDEPVIVQLVRLNDGAPDWFDRVPIGEIPIRAFGSSRIAHVILSTQAPDTVAEASTDNVASVTNVSDPGDVIKG
jgi:hypothetical protein